MKISERSLWTLQAASGVVILVLLGLHMGIMHFDDTLVRLVVSPASDEAIDWQNVAARGRMTFFTVTYVLLLGLALFHGLNGLRNILFELAPPRRTRTLIVAVLTVVGAGLLVLGTWAAVAARTAAAM